MSNEEVKEEDGPNEIPWEEEHEEVGRIASRSLPVKSQPQDDDVNKFLESKQKKRRAYPQGMRFQARTSAATTQTRPPNNDGLEEMEDTEPRIDFEVNEPQGEMGQFVAIKTAKKRVEKDSVIKGRVHPKNKATKKTEIKKNASDASIPDPVPGEILEPKAVHGAFAYYPTDYEGENDDDRDFLAGDAVDDTGGGEQTAIQQEQTQVEGDSHLISATLVTEPVIVAATKDSWWRRSRWWIIACIITLIIVIVVGSVVGTQVRRTRTIDAQSNLSPQAREFREIITRAFPDETFSNESSPAFQALVFLADNSSDAANFTDIQILRRWGLSTLFYSTNGTDSWTRSENWLTDEAECTWEGVGCRTNAEDEVLTSLSLSNNSLQGSLPIALGVLSNLTSLDLSQNELVGPVPSQIGLLTALTSLQVSENQLSDRLPRQMGQLSFLSKIDLSFNAFDGAMPPELAAIPRMQQIMLNNNNLNGGIPTEIGMATELLQFSIAHNQLSETIPSEMGMLSKLQSFDLSDNSVCGSLSRELGNMRSLTDWNMTNNIVTRSIPPSIGRLRNLTSLDWSFNSLSGTLPTTIGQLSRLIGLRLNRNGIPSFRFQIMTN